MSWIGEINLLCIREGENEKEIEYQEDGGRSSDIWWLFHFLVPLFQT
jgi:hypothetical protein